MSVRKMAEVWELDLPQNEKFVLLAFADFADDEGRCYPSMRRIAWKTGYHERHIKRIMVGLRDRGLLEVMRPASPTFPAIYRVMPARGTRLSPLETAGGDILSFPWFEDAQTADSGDKKAPKPDTARGDKQSPLGISNSGRNVTPPVTNRHPGGGEMSPEGVTNETHTGDTHVTPGVTPMSPNPPDNHQRNQRGADRSSKLPPDFGLNPEREAYARKKGIKNPAGEMEKFRAHHKAHGSRMVDWDATWHTWCLKAHQFGNTGPVPSPRKSDAELARQRKEDEAAVAYRAALVEQRIYKLEAQQPGESNDAFVKRIYREAGEAMVERNVGGAK